MTTLYRLYDRDQQLLYVGIAGNPGRRFEQHRGDKPRWGEVSSIRVEHYPTREAAIQAELAAIHTESPRHNIQGNTPITGRQTAAVTANGMFGRAGRLTLADEAELHPGSLVGSYFLGDRERQWQGCIVAEIAAHTYLAELFSWLTGASTEQRIVPLEEMADWTFYDDPEWFRDAPRDWRQPPTQPRNPCD